LTWSGDRKNASARGEDLDEELDLDALDEARADADAERELWPGKRPAAARKVMRKSLSDCAPGRRPLLRQRLAALRDRAGAPLPAPLRERLEGALGADLSPVRVHTGPESAAAADALGARAFTIGQDIHFGAGMYDPSSSAGEELIAHEVVHTVQDVPAAGGAIEVSRPGDALELEASSFAEEFARSSAVRPPPGDATQRLLETVAAGGGHLLPPALRRDLADRLGVDGAELRLIHVPRVAPRAADASATIMLSPRDDLKKAIDNGDDLSGIDLRGADLSGMNLAGVNLAGHDMAGAVLASANMSGANFAAANLQGAVIASASANGTNFAAANLQGAVAANVSANGANFAAANLQSAQLVNASLAGANLPAANLQGAQLVNANLPAANLAAANLQGAQLVNANLPAANLPAANLQGAQLVNANLPAANLPAANLQGAQLVNATMPAANLPAANLQGAQLVNATMPAANLPGANLQGAMAVNITLNSANLSGANLQGVNFRNANLSGANLTGANVTGAHIEGSDITGVVGLAGPLDEGAPGEGEQAPDGSNGGGGGGCSCNTPLGLDPMDITDQASWARFWTKELPEVPLIDPPLVVNVPKIGPVQFQAAFRAGMDAGIEGYFGPGQIRGMCIDLNSGKPATDGSQGKDGQNPNVQDSTKPQNGRQYQACAELYFPIDLLAHATANDAVVGQATHQMTGAQVELEGILAANAQFHWHSYVAIPVQAAATRHQGGQWVFTFTVGREIATKLRLSCNLEGEIGGALQFDLDGPDKNNQRSGPDLVPGQAAPGHGGTLAPQHFGPDPGAWNPIKDWNPLPPFNPGPPNIPDPIHNPPGGPGGGGSKVVVRWSRRWTLAGWAWETGWQFKSKLVVSSENSSKANARLDEDPSFRENLQPGALLKAIIGASNHDDSAIDEGGGGGQVGIQPVDPATMQSAADDARAAQRAAEHELIDEEDWEQNKEKEEESVDGDEDVKAALAAEKTALKAIEARLRDSRERYLGALGVASDPHMMQDALGELFQVKDMAASAKFDVETLKSQRGKPAKKTTKEEDLRTARSTFRRRLFTSEELCEALGKPDTTCRAYRQDWQAQGILFVFQSNEYDRYKMFSFDRSKAGERPVADGPSNRVKYGYVNPDKESGPGLTILSKGLIRQPKDPADLMNAEWHKTQAEYRSWNKPGRRFKWPNAILGHEEGASVNWNREGHKRPRSGNLAWNRDPKHYGGPELDSDSSASGADAPRYRVPHRDIGSHESWCE
jgi:uncharacterized protein YjbI with pentapeptide repeats